ncbi:hypothetical protein [Planctomyces sp. SH-PL62]|uniref:hypothetical protein n=1 Tax=Planctomyces sp. SH-PL62 TaxID=1636152 RepID=UPI00078CD36C|nr:hypothetical protein [Planctomyces sp. SH-PL62]AMV37687.1 hypothetical protein VT85_09640 [Planctomyces sp. SH-PL62]
MWAFLRVFCFLGLPCFAIASCAIWRPVASWEGPRLPAATRAVAPILVLLAIGFPIVGIPVVLLMFWLLPRVPADRPTPIRDRLAWTAFALGISLMVTMAVFAMTQEGDGDWRPFATIRLHTRIFLGMASFALVGPLAAFLLSRGTKGSPLSIGPMRRRRPSWNSWRGWIRSILG